MLYFHKNQFTSFHRTKLQEHIQEHREEIYYEAELVRESPYNIYVFVGLGLLFSPEVLRKKIKNAVVVQANKFASLASILKTQEWKDAVQEEAEFFYSEMEEIIEDQNEPNNEEVKEKALEDMLVEVLEEHFSLYVQRREIMSEEEKERNNDEIHMGILGEAVDNVYHNLNCENDMISSSSFGFPAVKLTCLKIWLKMVKEHLENNSL